MDVVEPRFRWTFPTPVERVAELLAVAAADRGLSERVAPGPGRPRRRPIRTTLDAWFADPLDALHDPALLPDIDRLLERV